MPGSPPSATGPTEDSDEPQRRHLTELLHRITPWDDQERTHRDDALAWIGCGAPLYRTSTPDIPATHLVSYFAALDEQREQILLGAHRKAGLWLPSGGHVEPREDPWKTVERECLEELDTPAVPSPIAGTAPLFVTITRTRGTGPHTDVSLWFVLHLAADATVTFDTEEFHAIKWLPLRQVLAEPLDTLDPHMHRFTRKTLAALHHTDGTDSSEGPSDAHTTT